MSRPCTEWPITRVSTTGTPAIVVDDGGLDVAVDVDDGLDVDDAVDVGLEVVDSVDGVAVDDDAVDEAALIGTVVVPLDVAVELATDSALHEVAARTIAASTRPGLARILIDKIRPMWV